MAKRQANADEGLRERKRRETRQKIAEVGLRLFARDGYEETTLETIAAEAGISARTLFYYFPTKEDVLLAWHGGGIKSVLKAAMLEESRELAPLDAARECLLKLAQRYETKESVTINRVLQSVESLRARKEMEFVAMEAVLLDALWEMWPAKRRREELRLVARLAMGILRLALDQWVEENGKRSMRHYVRGSFARFEAMFSTR